MAMDEEQEPQSDMPRRASRPARSARSRNGGRGRTNWIAVACVIVVVVIVLVGGVFLGVRAQLARQDAVPAQAATRTAVATTSPPPTQPAVQPTQSVSPEASSARIAPVEVADPARDQAVPVLMYHHIMPVPNNSIAISPSAFDAQMKYLHDNGYHPVSMAQFDAFVLTGKRLPSKPVLITFDDGRMNQLTYGVPILQKYGFTATFFVVKKWIVTTSPSFFHVPELKQLIADGYDVESHTTNHIQIHPSKTSSGGTETYTKFKARYWEPTNGMRLYMDQTLGGPPVIALAYPGGRFNPDAEKLMKDSGYDVAFTTNDGYVTYKGQSQYALPRWNTGARGTTQATFILVVAGALKHHSPTGK